MSPASKLFLLHDRAKMMAKVRAFFDERGVVEVDCPLLHFAASVDAHIDLIMAHYAEERLYYLHSSPEYGMKRLLAEGMDDIYQLSHVFRDKEVSLKHHPEFTMAEWYRLDIDFHSFIDESVDFARLFLGDLSCEIITYRQAIKKYAGIDYVGMSERELLAHMQREGMEVYPAAIEEGVDALLNIILACKVEPHLGRGGFTVLAYYPSSQAALAQTQWHGNEQVAERFEIYRLGIELANGYHELADAEEQRERFLAANRSREKLGKKALPIDEDFLKALEKGLPDCCGVAVGFDRLMMLRHRLSDIRDVLVVPSVF